MVGVPHRGSNVVEHPHDLLSQGDVVALQSAGTVEQELLNTSSIQASETPFECSRERVVRCVKESSRVLKGNGRALQLSFHVAM